MRRERFGFWGVAVREVGRRKEEARAVAEARMPRREICWLVVSWLVFCWLVGDFMMGILAVGGGDFLGC